MKTIGERVAQAASEGGVLGFGGVKVSEPEKATLSEIAKASACRRDVRRLSPASSCSRAVKMSRFTTLCAVAVASAFAAVCLAVVGLAPSSHPPTPTSIPDVAHPPRLPAPTAHTEVRADGAMIAQADWLDWFGDSFSRGDRQRPARRMRFDRGEEPERRKQPQPRSAPSASGFAMATIGRSASRMRVTASRRMRGSATRAAHLARACSCTAIPARRSRIWADLDGSPYRKLATAFLYRAQYVADCTCRGQPWEEEARTRHPAYVQTGISKTIAKAR